MDPDPLLSFELGETIYENTRVGEWIRLWKISLGALLISWPAFNIFEIYAGDGAPSLQWLFDAGFWHTPPLQFNDGGSWNLEQVRYCDDNDYMNMQYGVKRGMARPMHTFYQISVLTLLSNLSFDYVSKMVYNRDKDLVFVYKQDNMFTDYEYVYEVHHLEQMLPSPVGAASDLSSLDEKGILTLSCTDTHDTMRFYNDKKYWNLDMREDFLSQTRNFWRDGSSSKDFSRVLDVAREPDTKEEALMVSLISFDLA